MANTEQQVLDRLPSVEDVLSACNISFAPPKGNNEINIDCPFCDDTRRRFFFDTRGIIVTTVAQRAAYCSFIPR